MPKTRKMNVSRMMTLPSCGSDFNIDTTSAERRGDDLSERSGRSTRTTRKTDISGSPSARNLRYSIAPDEENWI